MNRTQGDWNAQLADRLGEIPLFDGQDVDRFEIERLGGLTNLNYRVRTPKDHLVVRLAGPGTSDYIDRAVEHHNASAASQAGVNAELLYFDRESGTMVTRYLENSTTMTIEGFRDLGAPRRAAHPSRLLHQESDPFHCAFALSSQLDRYLAVLEKRNAPIPQDYRALEEEAQAVRRALCRWPLPTAPCHCDPLYENFLDTGERMYIIDFEYAGNTDPMWDLGDLSVEGEFTPEQDRELMLAYFGQEPPRFEWARMVMHKALCDLLWSLWGVVQHINENPADDFWAYAEARLARCRRLMETAEFHDHLRAVEAGPQG